MPPVTFVGSLGKVHAVGPGCANIHTGGTNTINHIIPRAAPLFNIADHSSNSDCDKNNFAKISKTVIPVLFQRTFRSEKKDVYQSIAEQGIQYSWKLFGEK